MTIRFPPLNLLRAATAAVRILPVHVPRNRSVGKIAVWRHTRYDAQPAPSGFTTFASGTADPHCVSTSQFPAAPSAKPLIDATDGLAHRSSRRKNPLSHRREPLRFRRRRFPRSREYPRPRRKPSSLAFKISRERRIFLPPKTRADASSSSPTFPIHSASTIRAIDRHERDRNLIWPHIGCG